MANLTSTTITGTLNTTSTITGPASGASALNASNVSSGTLSSDRLPTVPTSKGGTGLTSVVSEGQVITVTAPGSLEFQDAEGGGGGYKMTDFTSPGTYTKPADVQDLKVTVVGGGGGSGYTSQSPSSNEQNSACLGGAGGGGGTAIEYLPEASVPGPVSVTVGSGGAGGVPRRNNPGGSGGTSSFGAFLSATGATGGCRCGCDKACPQSTGGLGSGGNLNFRGGHGAPTFSMVQACTNGAANNGAGGTHLSGDGGGGCPQRTATDQGHCRTGDCIGGSNSGVGGGASLTPYPCGPAGGADGVVIVEEFF
jgi:hypothetical protein